VFDIITNTLEQYKESQFSTTKLFIHCRNNATKLKKSIPCIKCQFQDKRLRRKFDNIRSVYQHIIYLHSGIDSEEYPSKSFCIYQLQLISDLINEGLDTVTFDEILQIGRKLK